ncbi:hypothetical protein CRENBAI_007683 [Crenichthys baileyi]|uniref:Uncharacterized protein n=1 Tax=Crenichthys baileyi TaxID=28760 RepID=A0AAV9SCE0_9TELE
MGCRAASLGQIGQSVAELRSVKCAERAKFPPRRFQQERPTDTGSTFSTLCTTPPRMELCEKSARIGQRVRKSVSPKESSEFYPRKVPDFPGYTRPGTTPWAPALVSKCSIDFCLTLAFNDNICQVSPKTT